MGKSVTRLYTQFQPSHYDLRLSLDKTNMTFAGTVTIEGKKVGRPSQRITLHQRGLKISKATIVKHDKKGDQPVELERINNQDSYDEVRLHATGMVYPGDYTLTLEFTGSITRAMTGIYPCFFEYEGEEHSLLMTQFESHYAREAFTCIDEPEAKATFDMTLETETGLTVLGNTPVKEQNMANDRLVTTFETTPRMSTYLLAFVAGELQSKSTQTDRGVEVNVWATMAQPANSLDYPLEIAKKSIEFFEDYFGLHYPLPKADHVACPDFSAGAMENWGLITYRERALLVYPGETAQSMQEYIATVIAHETSHQWFGNLVTMKWWDDLWLNESFANLMEYQAVDAMHPEWKLWETFIAQEGLSALRRDATPGVQAVKTTVNHPDEISTLFDPSIVYAKGGRLLYMLKSYIGDDAFRTGLSQYFETHKYGNTTGVDLWNALSAASGIDVAAFMNPWLEQSGFPVITVNQTDRSVTLQQQHFSDNPDKVEPDRQWPVPLFSEPVAEPALLVDRLQTVELLEDDVLRVNAGARGHYIVNYETDKQRQALRDLIAEGILGVPDRLMLLNDTSMLARAGIRKYGDVLGLLEAYSKEDSEPVWDMLSLIVAESRRFIDLDESLEDKIKAMVRGMIRTEYDRLGWEEKQGESASDQKLRATIIGLGSYAEDAEIVQRATKLFEQYKANPDVVIPELRGIVFTVPVKQNVEGAVDYLIGLHDKTGNSELKAEISSSLTATRSPEVAVRLLDRITDPKLVKPQDADRWLIYLLRNRYVKEVAWNWMVNNWHWIEDTYKQDKSYDMLPRYAASMVNTQEWADKYRGFFVPMQDQIVLKRNILMGLEEIAARVTWLERDLASVQAFFNKQS